MRQGIAAKNGLEQEEAGANGREQAEEIGIRIQGAFADAAREANALFFLV
jgi:predicted NUDIX family NTP pyrophosphohydrolase